MNMKMNCKVRNTHTYPMPRSTWKFTLHGNSVCTARTVELGSVTAVNANSSFSSQHSLLTKKRGDKLQAGQQKSKYLLLRQGFPCMDFIDSGSSTFFEVASLRAHTDHPSVGEETQQSGENHGDERDIV